MSSFVSPLFQKRKGVEETSIFNSPKRLRHVEEKATSNNNAPKTKYDVFVSFRGEIRDGFLSHLIEAFKTNHINSFVDDRLERGNEVWPSLVEAIEGSSISLIIFSEDYASSRWCLEELITILKCRDENGQIVIPVFYKVEPTHVRHRSSKGYKNAFVKHKKNKETNLQIWRDALKKMAKISGIVSSSWKNDAELVKEIVRHVLQKKPVKHAVNSKRLVGIDEKIATLESLIKEEPTVTRVIGIWGMGGLGKTTLAGVVFHKLQHEYGGSCLLLNERDRSNKCELISLKKEIFSQLLRDDVKIYTLDTLPGDIVSKIGRIKVLIVLDDVNDSRHIKELLGNLEDFGLGSRIIITTRNEQVLKTEADVTYELPGLNSNEALELFILKAFKKLDDQRDEYNKLLERVVHYAQGIPLVLVVLAGHLCGNTKEVWEGELDKLEKMPHKEVYDVMIWSYENLDREQKQSFLDIACFFLKSHHVAKVGDLKFLLKDDESGNSVVSNLEKLKEKALITFSKDNVVSMHDVLQETAWEIVRQKFIECLGSCSWLWDPVYIYETLKNDKVSEAIRSLQISLPKMKERKLIPHIFANMSRLQFLEIFGDDLFNQRHTLAEGLQFLSTELRFLNFEFYPLQSLPENFSTEKLVVLKLQFNRMEKLWDDVKNLVNLKTLDLSFSKMLKELPDLSKAINLEVLLLCGCSMLTSVHLSIFSLPELEKLDLSWCSSFTELGSDSDFCKLEMRNLCGTDIEKIPPSIKIRNTFRLILTILKFCKKLQKLSGHLPYHQTPDVSGCTSLQTLNVNQWVEHLPYHQTPDVSGCTSLETLNFNQWVEHLLYHQTPDVSGCTSLETLNVNQWVEHLPYHQTLDVSGCTSLETLNVSQYVEHFPYHQTPDFCKLEMRNLCGTDIEKIPPSIKIRNTFRLILTILKFCKELQKLSGHLPYHQTPDVSGCTSLQTLNVNLWVEHLPYHQTPDVSGCTSLETLNVNQWVEHLPYHQTPDVSGCTSLETLNVNQWVEHLPYHQTLDVSGCTSLETLNVSQCVEHFPYHQTPDLSGCTSLETLNVSHCESLRILPKLPLALKTLIARECKLLGTLPELPPTLEILEVPSCKSLQILPKLPLSLKTIIARGCILLGTLPELPSTLETLDVWDCTSLKTLPELPSTLQTLDVSFCSSLETLPKLPLSLKTLKACKCDLCRTLPELPPSLVTLDVHFCSSLETLPELPLILETLDVSSCTSLETLPELPPSLKTLRACECDLFRTLPELALTLATLDVSGCKLLITLPELPPALETLDVVSCTSLETLPELPSTLENLDVSSCTSLETLPELPPSLKTLRACECDLFRTLPELALTLATLDVSDCKLLRTLPELPPTLETLDVVSCTSLETLPELPPSLKTLRARECNLLRTLPELPPSLETLDVHFCNSLETLPELPRSLKTLNVSRCRALQSLRELPLSLETLEANHCKSLKTVLFPSTAVEQLKESLKQVMFWDCLNVDEHSLLAIGLNAQISMMKFAHHHLSSPNHDHVENYDDSNPAIYLYPGSRVPEWMENKTTKDYIIIDLSSAPASPHWSFIFCFVFDQYQDAKYIRGLEVNLIISDEDGEGKRDSVTMYILGMIGIIESSHVCVMYDQRCSGILNSRAKNKMRFKIQVTLYERFLSTLPQGVLKGFGVSPINSSAYGNFIQQMQLHDT